MKRLVTIVLVAGQLAACASASTRAGLNNAKAACAGGDQFQCNMVKGWQDRADSEASENAGKVAIGVLLVPLIALAAVAGAQSGGYGSPSNVRTTTCNSYGGSWGRTTNCTSY